jgi:tetratricopeptide (TPR) repeat protein
MVFGFIKNLTGEDNDLVKEGDELFYMGEYDKALANYKTLLVNKDSGHVKRKIKSGDINYLKKEGNRLFDEGNYMLALSKFNKVLKLSP